MGFRHSWIQVLKDCCSILRLLCMVPHRVAKWLLATASWLCCSNRLENPGQENTSLLAALGPYIHLWLLHYGWEQNLWWKVYSNWPGLGSVPSLELQVGSAPVKPHRWRPWGWRQAQVGRDIGQVKSPVSTLGWTCAFSITPNECQQRISQVIESWVMSQKIWVSFIHSFIKYFLFFLCDSKFITSLFKDLGIPSGKGADLHKTLSSLTL